MPVLVGMGRVVKVQKTKRTKRPMWWGSAVDDLRDAEVFEAFDAEFEAVSGLLGAAEGDAGVDVAVFVDPDCADLVSSRPLPIGIAFATAVSSLQTDS